MPAHLLYGDSFFVAEALQELQRQVGPPEVLDANSHRFVASQAALDQLKGVCDAMPFLAEKRLVVVEGLFYMFDARGRRPRRRAASSRGADTLSSWDGLDSYLELIPPSTILVFLDGRLNRGNPLLRRVRELLQVREFSPLTREVLARWIRDRISAKGGNVTPGAIALLSQMVGNNLWALDMELEKLTLYSTDRSIEEADVRLLVSQVREASIFTAIDAMLDDKIGIALPLIRQLREEGAEFSYVLSMIARQLRLVILAREMLERGLAGQQIGGRLGIGPDFAIKRTLAQARKHTHKKLVGLYQRLLESDLAVKSGNLDEELALDLLVGGLLSPSPSG